MRTKNKLISDPFFVELIFFSHKVKFSVYLKEFGSVCLKKIKTTENSSKMIRSLIESTLEKFTL